MKRGRQPDRLRPFTSFERRDRWAACKTGKVLRGGDVAKPEERKVARVAKKQLPPGSTLLSVLKSLFKGMQP